MFVESTPFFTSANSLGGSLLELDV